MDTTSPVSIKTAAQNLRTISNSANSTVYDFRVVEKISSKNEKLLVIEKRNFIVAWFLSILSTSSSFKSTQNSLTSLINSNVSMLSSLERDKFVSENGAVTEIFISAQKFNQTMSNADEARNRATLLLFKEITPNFVKNPHVTELNPIKLVKANTEPLDQDLKQTDKPHVHTEGFFSKLRIQRYDEKDANINHGAEAKNIFISTQKERLLSGIGKIVEACVSKFGGKTEKFQKYHFFKNNEDKDPSQIYRNDSPLSVNTPTSYWLGHATCLISVPLQNANNKTININLITDPIEGDINGILYPRQTKVARKMENNPAPHVFLLSHNHFDHYDQATIDKLLTHQPIMIVPSGDGVKFRNRGFTNVIEQNWWDKTSLTFKQDDEEFHMDITGVPAHHWAGQGPCGGHESAFLGYVISGAKEGDIYFAGDTARLSEGQGTTDHVGKLREKFNIRWMFQPGGPDEVRADMESTHQASVDGLWMHFHLLVKNAFNKHSENFDKFLDECAQLKTIYMHTETFKLGALHFDDTLSGINAVKEALEATTDQVVDYKELPEYKKMKYYEQQVYEELMKFTKLKFTDGNKLTPQVIKQMIDKTVIIPKIGERTEFNQNPQLSSPKQTSPIQTPAMSFWDVLLSG